MTEYKYLGLLAVTILLFGLIFIVLMWPDENHLSFSQRVAKSKHRIVYYNALFTIVLPMLLLFFLGWFMPTFELSAWFGFFIVLSSIAQYGCTLIPEIGGWETRYHRILAGVSAIFLLPVLLILLYSDPVGIISKSVSAVCFGIMLGIIFLVAKNKGQHNHFLLLQSTYFGAFFLSILFVAYM